ncbi:MAG: hypothetical protein OEV73_00150 [Desulfobulbaceae bacterium]|nr:hypothetical protein [Desulfobulbaceae bacterium]
MSATIVRLPVRPPADQGGRHSKAACHWRRSIVGFLETCDLLELILVSGRLLSQPGYHDYLKRQGAKGRLSVVTK